MTMSADGAGQRLLYLLHFLISSTNKYCAMPFCIARVEIGLPHSLPIC